MKYLVYFIFVYFVTFDVLGGQEGYPFQDSSFEQFFQQEAIEREVVRWVSIDYSSRKSQLWGLDPDVSRRAGSKLHYLIEITREADEIIDQICGEIIGFDCWPVVNNFYFTDIEYLVIDWSVSSYQIRQDVGEPQIRQDDREPIGIDMASFSDTFQRLVQITREKDSIIKNYREDL